MIENDIHKLLLSYGMLPMLSVLKELEVKEDYSNCVIIRDAVNSFKSRFSFVFSPEKEIQTEEEYLAYYENIKTGCSKIAKSNMQYYISDIKEKLKL
jgi:hypothetical protein